MGLDMYLYKETYINQHNDKGLKVELKKNGRRVDSSRVSYVKEEVKYWRKANAIHKWFIDNCGGGVDNCEPIYVSLEKLKELRSLCSEVLGNPDEAENLLPTQDGFFFGSTEYDEWYFGDVEETLGALMKILDKEDNTYANYWYQASW